MHLELASKGLLTSPISEEMAPSVLSVINLRMLSVGIALLELQAVFHLGQAALL